MPLTPVSPGWIPEWEVRGRHRGSLWRQITPPQLFVGSFLVLILIGTLGLKTLPGLYTGPPLTWLDALFTATSAVCVTGLIVVDTATYFTPWGQAFLLVLIQLGGLGMITLTTFIILALGRRLSIRHEGLATGPADVTPDVNFRKLTGNVIRFTLLLEAVGAIVLYLLWAPRFGWGGATWPAIFHSVSAFCNAGFSIFSNSLESFQTSPLTLSVIMALIVIGGIGFLTLTELRLWGAARRTRSAFHVSLHSRLVLAVTGILLASAWLLFSYFEWDVTLAHLRPVDRALNALFMSVTARTAGFNTVDYATTTETSNFLTIILMYIGGSPSSTAGGIKTTTVGLVLLLAWSRFRKRSIANVWNRSVPGETVQRATGLAVVAFAVTTIAIFLYTVTELAGVAHPTAPGAFLVHVFEATSAFNTVGLSMGATPELTPWGRVLTILLMYIGRVGPLTFAAAIALAKPTTHREFRYAYEDVVVG